MKFKHFSLLVIPYFLLGCAKDYDLLYQAEAVLPGDWKIESVQLPVNGSGITYNGFTFKTDTILYDVGEILINDFSAEQLNSASDPDYKALCELSIGNETFPYRISELFLSGDDLFCIFNTNFSDGTDLIDTPGEEFIWSSFIFNNTYKIDIQNMDHIRLLRSNHQESNIITLSRI